ncbi:apoptosis-enhancing nuclease [Hoplias malabaricus]|uniref:apoptosis-enhancing nuclease n=1 Tax=Hoplias malabaricus TaxID=27720 RepID=UPI00346337ED
MSTPGPLSNVGASQSIWGPLNLESTLLSSVKAKRCTRRKLRETENKKETRVIHCQEMCCKLEKSKKRKSSEFLEEQASGVRSLHSDDTGSDFGAPLDSTKPAQPVKAKRAKVSTLPVKSAASLHHSWEVDSGFSSESSPPTSGRSSPCIGMNPSMLVAMDCEMVGTGPNGHCSELARCSILNYSGTVIYDKYILPRQPVTDYRTRWSGITKEHLKQALPFKDARNEILHILKGKVIVGHALHNDFKVLGISVQREMTRDTASMHLLQQLYGTPKQRISLKKLSKKLLSRNIQVSRAGHCSIEDALAALDLYKLVEEQWEKSLQIYTQSSYFIPEPTSSLEHYMEDQYWPENMTDCNQ